ncbi:hypothetical protein HFN89_03680 [Rhizobium laguerreae]|nr:hypothetical protein [Rhizobium laguerreae]
MRRSNRKYSLIGSFVGIMSTDAEVLTLLAYSVGRVLYNTQPDDYNPTKHPEHLEAGRHVADWIAAAIANREPWLSNVDALGRPKKLLKFPTLEAITREADEAMIRYARKNRDVALREGDEELVMALADGYYAVRLLTPAALDRESGQMQHCIGAGSYDKALATGSAEFFSLRDAAGNAHATMEVETGGRTIVQLQGKQNKVPEDRYIRLLLPLMKTMRFGLDRLHLGKTRFIDDGYNFVDLHNLASGTVINGHVYIENEGKIVFPDVLEVRGTFKIVNCDNVRMPANLSVTGDLVLDRTDDVTKCHDLKVGGALRVTESNWDEIADYLDAGSVLVSASSVSKLADTLVVRRDLHLKECAIRDLGSLESLEGVLSLSRLPRFEFKKPIKVGGRLNLPGYEMDRLPEEVYGYTSLTIQNSAITELPGGLVLKELDISSTPIKELPADLEVSSRLTAWECAFAEIPRTAKLRGEVDINRSKCKVLPDGMTLESLDVSYCEELIALPSDLTVKHLKAVSSKVRHIGNRLVVHKEAGFNRSDIVAIPADAEFHGDVYARQCDQLREVGRALFGGKLHLQGSGPLVMANGLDIVGDLVLGEVDRLPHGLCVGGDLITEGDLSGVETAVLGGKHVQSTLSVAVLRMKNSARGIG